MADHSATGDAPTVSKANSSGELEDVEMVPGNSGVHAEQQAQYPNSHALQLLLQNNGSLIGAPALLNAASAGMGSFYRINPSLVQQAQSIPESMPASMMGSPNGLAGQPPQQAIHNNVVGGASPASVPNSMSAHGKPGVLKKARHQLFYFFSPNTKAGKKVTADLTGLYTLAAHRRWLRGCMAAIAVFSIIIGLLNMITDVHNDVLYATNSLACLVGVFCVIKLYSIKATLAGLSNPLFEGRSSLLHSPYFAQMVFELALWIHTPPFLVEYVWFHFSILDYLAFFRLYHICLYLKEVVFGHRMFVRILSSIGRIPISTSYFLRTGMVYEKTKMSITVISMTWIAIALAFHQAEGRHLSDSFYFVFVTAGTIGYGDIAPSTAMGKVIAFVAWVFGLMLIGWVVSLFQVAINLSESEKNLYLMSRASKLSRQVQKEAAVTIQLSWRFYRLYRHTKVVNGVQVLTREASAAVSAVKEDGTSNLNVSQILGTGGRDVVTSNANQRKRLQLSYQAWMLTLQCRRFKKIQHELRQDVIIIEKQLNKHENSLGEGSAGYAGYGLGPYPELAGIAGSFGGRLSQNNLGAMYHMHGVPTAQQNLNVEDRKRTLSDMSIVNTPDQGPLAPPREASFNSREEKHQQPQQRQNFEEYPKKRSPTSLDNTVNSLNGDRASATAGDRKLANSSLGALGKINSSPKQGPAKNTNATTAVSAQQAETVANRKLYQELKKFTTVLTQVAEQQSVLLMTIQELKSDVKRVQEDQERMRRNPMRHLFLEGNRSNTPPPPPPPRQRAASLASPTGTNTPSGSLLYRPSSFGGSSFGPHNALASTMMGNDELPAVLRDSGPELGSSFPPANGSTRANSDDMSPPGSHNSDLPDPFTMTRRHSM